MRDISFAALINRIAAGESDGIDARAVQDILEPLVPLTLVVSDWSLNCQTHQVETPVGTFYVRPVDFRLLKFMMQHPDCWLSSELLQEAVWGFPVGFGREASVRVAVRTLRVNLEIEPNHPTHILGAPRVGYMLSSRGPLEDTHPWIDK